MSEWLWLAPAIGPVCLLFAWLSYLRFARWLVTHTGDPADLKHAAALARAMRKQPDEPSADPPGADVHPT